MDKKTTDVLKLERLVMAHYGFMLKDSSVQASKSARAWRGAILHTRGPEELVFLKDGGLLVSPDGIIEACADWKTIEQQGLLERHPYETTILPPHHLLIPGLIDLHVHLPQLPVTGCQAPDLLSWLDTHIFPAEARFSDAHYAHRISQWFFEQLLRNGTTTAAVFLTSHNKATRIAFEAAQAQGNRVIMGQNLMDKNAPPELIKPAAQMLAETEAHCRQWHGQDQGRLQYAWMPRFAITSSEELLEGLGRLRRQYPDVYLHTHLSEQPTEVEAVQRQFPWATDYTHVYERFGLPGPRTIFAHGIHLGDSELDRLQASQSALAHCPSSNFFLKSGRFRLFEVLRRHMLLGLGSDVGAGPELNLFRVIKDGQAMQSDALASLTSLFHAATLGGAQALFQADRIGNFEPGKEADFVVLSPLAKPGFAPPDSPDFPNDPDVFLSRLVHLGDDRMVRETWVRGQQVYQAPEGSQPKPALV